MQRAEESSSVIEPSAQSLPEWNDTYQEGEFCDTTKRVIIISPLPGSLRTLVAALTEKCYDVLVFHHENDPALTMLQADLLVLDRTRGQVGEKLQLSGNGKQLLLVAEEGADVGGAEAMHWPQPVETALEVIEKLADQGSPAVAVLPDNAEQLVMKDITVDLKRMIVQRSGQPINLTKTEFDMLKALLTSGGSVLTRQDIMERIWGDGYFGGSNSVDVHIKSLRHKLGDDPKNPHYIVTVRGVGYRMAE
ncbi:two-component system alkaline phosphatase synthesis response regulator PhoP [Paenibacillus phyllosphaerae]|uniref:Two-component system alkaline phosphatase synthesis response regulator PhoP n=1 Tax=Paenibacillus phyllosphaerae TaxID=274593 RepID=A0A7W5FNF3_9BACL|nr:winged helix family transcriptional regulator [Paenibacillus phyllosphaerae]MBB3111281.1 two-component system alkaline phosphatase synthesis response regulator PhoP [Paenibacillus phyllosphaerae]